MGAGKQEVGRGPEEAWLPGRAPLAFHRRIAGLLPAVTFSTGRLGNWATGLEQRTQKGLGSSPQECEEETKSSFEIAGL